MDAFKQQFRASMLTEAFTLCGVASMLWVVTPPELIRAPWLLVLLPAAFAGIAVGCMTVAQQRYNLAVFTQTRQQFNADPWRCKLQVSPQEMCAGGLVDPYSPHRKGPEVLVALRGLFLLLWQVLPQ